MQRSDIRSPRSVLAALAAVASLTSASCGGAPAPAPESAAPPAAAPAVDAAPAPLTSAAPVASSAPAAPPSAAPAASGPPAREPVLASSSLPEGIAPLSEADKKEMEAKCKPLADFIAATGKKAGRKKAAIEVMQEVLKSPPQLKGVDVPRCGDLMMRELNAYLARTIENEAIMTLKRISIGMSTALELEPPAFCPSAPPVPADAADLQKLPYVSTPADWRAPGWKCVRLDLLSAPQRYQYELKTDPKAQTFLATARGYPVKGGPLSELFLEGKAVGGKLQPTSEIKRR